MTILATRKPFIVRSYPDESKFYGILYYIRENGDEVCCGQIYPIPGYLHNHGYVLAINKLIDTYYTTKIETYPTWMTGK